MHTYLEPETAISAGEAVLRVTAKGAKPLFEQMRKNPYLEQYAFALARPVTTATGTSFVLNKLFLPDDDDLASQSAAGICPTREFQSYVYQEAQEASAVMVEFHTHPGGAAPRFSSIDQAESIRNARYIAERFPAEVTLVMIVGNNRFDLFDGIYYDRQTDRFQQLHRFEVLGRPTKVWSLPSPHHTDATPFAPEYDRQRRIPGWNQAALEAQRIGIIGLGGNGCPLLQTLSSIGAGRHGFIAVADHDMVEASNLPRLPYATGEHLGTSKVAVGTKYAMGKSPSTPFYPFACRFNESAVRDRFKAATVLFYCGDSDAGRKQVNDFAVRYGIPLVDLGCDVQVGEDVVLAGGQVRLVLPGENACLVCCRGFDPGQAALEEMGEAARAEHAAHGYVRGADADATPSVANLNGLTAQYAVSQFLALVHGEDFAQWDYLHFDQFNARTIPARTTWYKDCPLCGHDGILLQGDATTMAAPRGPVKPLHDDTIPAAAHGDLALKPTTPPPATRLSDGSFDACD